MFTLLRDMTDFLEDQYVTGPMATQLREELYKVLIHSHPFIRHMSKVDIDQPISLQHSDDSLRCVASLRFLLMHQEIAAITNFLGHAQVIQEVRPDAVALVDSFGFEDYVLNSAIGRHDGDVYTALLKAAEGSRLNETEEGPAWHDILKPVLTSSRAPSSKL